MYRRHARIAMRSLRSIPLAVLLSGLASVAQAQSAKKPLDHDVYDIWNRIMGQSISNDGRWILYHLVSEKNDPTLVVKNVAGDREVTIERGEDAEFSADSRYVVYRIKPAKQAVEPFPFVGSADSSRARLLDILERMPRTRVEQDEPAYLHVTFRSTVLRFIDDVELLVDDSARVIHVRSASRVGRGDFGVNRRRVEEIRRRFVAPRRP